MGADKAAMDYQGQRLIDIVHQRISAQCSAVMISGREAYGLGLPVMADRADGPKGPSAGVFAAYHALHSMPDDAGFFTVPVDGPNLPADFAARLYSENHSAVTLDEAGRHPTFGWWRFEDLKRAFGAAELSASLSLNRLADLCGAQDVTWAGQENFFNINRPDDLAG